MPRRSGTAPAATRCAGALLLQARGPAGALLRAWKTAQTLIEQASGSPPPRAASRCRQCRPGLPVESAPQSRAPPCRFARLAGGAGMHRLGLSESILIFPSTRQ
ncbi:MAG: hypothetical protein U1E43_05800 [Rhodospirillales bacterium]